MLTPLLFRILVKPFELEEVDPLRKSAKDAGIVFAVRNDQHVREKQAVDRGTVVAVGSVAFKEWGDDVPITVGSEVYFAKYAGKIVKDPHTDEEFLALNDEDLVVKIEKDNE